MSGGNAAPSPAPTGDDPMRRTVLFALLLSVSRAGAADDLPPRAVARLGDYRLFHGDYLRATALSHDGRRVALLVNTGDRVEPGPASLTVHDTATGAERRRWVLPHWSEDFFPPLALSPDGGQVALLRGGQADNPM